MEQIPVRRSARVLLFNGEDEVLLFRAFDERPLDPARENTPYWATVGGGLEDGETLEACARREVWEETGIRDVTLVAPVWRLQRVLHLGGVPTLCDEMYFYGRTRERRIDCSGWQPAEAACILEMRWWRVEEIGRSPEVFLPEGLVGLIARVARGEVPALVDESR